MSVVGTARWCLRTVESTATATAATAATTADAMAPNAAATSGVSPSLPAASPDQATLSQLSGVASAAEQRDLSDSLGVSSALYLGVSDTLRLRSMLEQPSDQAHALLVLRRLSTAPITLRLEETTGIAAFMAELQTDETVQAAALAGVDEALQASDLISRIVSVWEAQLETERKQRDAHTKRQQSCAHALPLKQKRAKDPDRKSVV